jgi:hypothetical protein
MANAHPPSTLDAALRAEALDVLHDVVQWRLTEPRWATVRTALDAMRAAFDAGDVEALRAAVHALELAGPVRANSLNGPPVEGVAQPVYDVANGLVHDLSGDETPAQPPEDPR